MTVGTSINRDVPASVFETPSAATYGMLGLQWIWRNRLVIDYRTQRLHMLPAAKDVASLAAGLLRHGYAALPMTSGAGGRFMVSATIGGVTRAMAVSTVADTILDTEFAKSAGVATGANWIASAARRAPRATLSPPQNR